jgi:hypothetical protein
LYFKARNYYQALRKYGLNTGFEISDPEKHFLDLDPEAKKAPDPDPQD